MILTRKELRSLSNIEVKERKLQHAKKAMKKQLDSMKAKKGMDVHEMTAEISDLLYVRKRLQICEKAYMEALSAPPPPAKRTWDWNLDIHEWSQKPQRQIERRKRDKVHAKILESNDIQEDAKNKQVKMKTDGCEKLLEVNTQFTDLKSKLNDAEIQIETLKRELLRQKEINYKLLNQGIRTRINQGFRSFMNYFRRRSHSPRSTVHEEDSANLRENPPPTVIQEAAEDSKNLNLL